MISRRRFLAQAAGLGAGLVAADRLSGQQRPGPATNPATDLPSLRELVTPATQSAINRGLDYLARQQAADGSWGERQYRGNVAVTSLAALALMAGGHQPGRGQYGESVARALNYVLSREARQPAGFLYNPAFGQTGPMYSHGFGTLFLAELHGMVPDRVVRVRLRETLARAVQLIVATQNDEGGWRYQPEPRQADISVTICQIMALRAARNVGLYVPQQTVDRCVRYVRECQTADGGFSYVPRFGPSAFARSAAGVVALFCAGIYTGREVERGIRYLQQYRPGQLQARRDIPESHYYYGHYYAAQAMWTVGGSAWANWFPAIREELLQRANTNPQGVWQDVTTCDTYATAMATIILQIPNNYLPILQK
jgi:hypothetical protein